MTQIPRKSRWHRFRRLAIRSLGVCLAIIVISLGTLPYWMGYTLQSLIRKDVVTIGKYETLGYGRFQLSDIQVNSGNVLLEMDRLEAPSPLNWAYRAAVHRTRAPSQRLPSEMGHDFAGDRIGQKAILVSLVVHCFQRFPVRLAAFCKFDPGI